MPYAKFQKYYFKIFKMLLKFSFGVITSSSPYKNLVPKLLTFYNYLLIRNRVVITIELTYIIRILNNKSLFTKWIWYHISSDFLNLFFFHPFWYSNFLITTTRLILFNILPPLNPNNNLIELFEFQNSTKRLVVILTWN